MQTTTQTNPLPYAHSNTSLTGSILNDSKLWYGDGAIIGVTAMKKDGTIRSYNGRFNVGKYNHTFNKLLGTEYVRFYDFNKRGYVSFRVDRVISVRHNGTEYHLRNMENYCE